MHPLAVVLFVVSLVFSAAAQATPTRTPTRTRTPTPTITPTQTPFVMVDCNTVIKVTDSISNVTLTLTNSHPIFSKTCPGNGLTIKNSGRGALDRTFTLDCNNAGVIKGEGKKRSRGIQLKGFFLNLVNCSVKGFGNGIVATGVGMDIENNVVQDSVGDGFVVKGRVPASLDSEKFYDAFVAGGNTATNNGGFGFRIKGNGVTLDGASPQISVNTFSNTATGNLRGGFSVIGKSHTVGNSFQASNDAILNQGPGFWIVNKSCCFPTSPFDLVSSLRALVNTGPGIVYIGLEDVFDTEQIVSASNGAPCPKGTTPAPNTVDGQICTGFIKCSDRVLDNCPF